jgi:hypothetical protein
MKSLQIQLTLFKFYFFINNFSEDLMRRYNVLKSTKTPIITYNHGLTYQNSPSGEGG